jgi:CRISPR system subtype II-B RNA-guided endonuclease Cas9/Csx12
MENRTISPIAIDLGAKYTGVLLPHYEAGEDVTETKIFGLVVVNSDKMTWSQQPRRQKRHQMRGYKRRKMAKRLLWLILAHEYGMERQEQPCEVAAFINGLLNRRGFTYLAEELDESALRVPVAALAELPGGLFNQSEPLEEQLARILSNPDKARKLLRDENFPHTKTDCRNAISDQFKNEKKEIVAAWEQIHNACEKVDKSENDGHRPRRDYLENIALDINESEILSQSLPEALSQKALGRLIGHISNLQLRVLRKYFNDPKMAGRGYWDPERLHRFFFRWVKSWHARKGTEERDRQRRLLAMRGKPVIDVFTGVDPNMTIPPYEDQNNRRPPKCMTVRLSEEKLDYAVPHWRDWVRKLRVVPANRFLDESAGEVEVAEATFLQRLMERSAALDPYQLRLLTNMESEEDRRQKPGYAHLHAVLGSATENFLGLCGRFYRETALARSGLWFDHEDRLLSLCNRVPPQKRKLKPQLLESILGIELTKEAVETLEQRFWNASQPKIQRRTCRSWARLAAEKQKEYGIHLRTAGEQQLARLETGSTLEDRDLALLYRNAPDAALALGEWFNLPAEQVNKFSSPHSLAQIFNILEGDINGFNRTCAACTAENIWRMKEESLAERTPDDVRAELPSRLGKPETAARAVRLSNDSTRPFDGQMAAIIDAIAREIVKEKLRQIGNTSDLVHVPLLVESNQFTFTDELAETKRQRNSKAAKRARELAEKTEAGWQEKNERIRAASRGICPYTGIGLGAFGDIDHIVPRSLSRDTRQTIFNSEANLIYCSSRGNHRKGDREYFLEDLDKRYLRSQFDTDNIAAIHQMIEEVVSPYVRQGRRLRAFSELTEIEQTAFRHALFDQKLRDEVIPLLEQRIKTRVNGTQAWLAKRIHHHLVKATSEGGPRIEVTAHHIDAGQVRQQRDLIAAIDSRWEKRTPQPASSHVVDAAAVFLHALEAPHTRPLLRTISSGSFEDEAWRSRLVPEVISVRRLEPRPKYRRDNPGSAPIFKDGIYAERFVPLLLDGEGLRAGYSLENSVVVRNPRVFFEALTPWLRSRKRPLDDTSYEAWLVKAADGLQYFEVDRSAAFRLLARPETSLSDEERIARALLESIRFTQQKVPVEKAFLDSQGRKLDTADNILKARDFTIKLNTPGNPVPRNTGAAGTVILPSIDRWRAITEDPEVASLLGGKAPAPGFWDSLYKRHFPRQSQVRHHKRVRKTFSLPRIKSPSGGFRVERKTPDGRAWQLVESDGYSAVGFAKNQNGVDFSSPCPLPSLAKSRSVTPLEELEARSPDSIVYFDDWREIPLEGDQVPKLSRLAYAPGSQDRFYVRAGFSSGQFREHVAPLLDGVDGPEDLLPTNRLPDPAKWEALLGPMLGKPRSDLFLVQTGNEVVLEYIVSSTKQVMKKAYARVVGKSHAASHHDQ